MNRAWCALLLAVATLSGSSATDTCWATAWRCDTVNTYRNIHDRPPLDQARSLQDSAAAWARHMAATGVLEHSPDAGRDYAEVVGYAPDFATVMVAWDGSPHHRAILLDDYTRVGIGRASDGDHVWFAVQVDRG